jgi:hypothetical protein
MDQSNRIVGRDDSSRRPLPDGADILPCTDAERFPPVEPKPYISISELSRLTPWTHQAIRSMISKGVFRPGVHYFHVGRRPIFKWTAVVAFIESREVDTAAPIQLQRGGFLGAPEA